MSFKHRWEAYSELLTHYKNVFMHFWKKRKKLVGSLYNENEADFLPAALSIQEKPVSKSARLVAKLIIAMVVIGLLWAFLGKMDIIVNAAGKIIPSEYTKTIATVETAIITALHVREGQSVKAGDILMELDSSAMDAEHDKAIMSVAEASLQIARFQTLLRMIDILRVLPLSKIDGIPDALWQKAQLQLDSQYLDFQAKLTRIDGDIKRYSQALPMVAQRASDYKILAQDYYVSTHAWLEKEQAKVDIEGQLNDAKNQRAVLIAQTRKEALDAITEARKVAAASRQDAKRSGTHSQLLKLIAPVDGTVQQLVAHTVGGVAAAAQPLMLIVPNEKHVEVEAFVENKDIGFVREGMSAEIKIDTFDYTKYGTVTSKVIHVSRDAIQDEKKGLIYLMKVMLEKNTLDIDGRMTPLSAGMSVNVEVKTGERRIIEYVLSPLIRHTHEALNER